MRRPLQARMAARIRDKSHSSLPDIHQPGPGHLVSAQLRLPCCVVLESRTRPHSIFPGIQPLNEERRIRSLFPKRKGGGARSERWRRRWCRFPRRLETDRREASEASSAGMGRSDPEEACGVWLDAAALKRRKVQIHLMKSSTKMLPLLPRERKATPRTPPAGVRQTSIASFFTLQSGKKNGDQRSVSSYIESQTNRESKKDATQLDHLTQGLGDDCVAPPLASSTPTDIQEAGLSPQSLQASGHHRLGTPFLTVLSSFQPETNLVCAGENQDSLACSFTQDVESSCLLDQKEGEKDSSWKREWLHGSKKKNRQGMERRSKPPGGKGLQPWDKPKLEKVSAKENRQAPVLFQTYRESWSGENTEAVKQRSCPVPVVSWDSEKDDRDSWSQLFTEDSQGQRVIAHNSRVPFREVTNSWNQGLGQFPSSPGAQCQDRLTQLNQPDLLFTQDSEGNQVIRHQV
ncbi:aurora kinase A- and ninein-interacting protein [Myotis yumanensis]|uniref:aurora kinase A- and ninein-interacting protein n=1 Tax=Myotis yumanensis TaxID=159337 RepID=UPI0038D1F40F